MVMEGKHDGAVVAKKIKINREYYTVARKYEFYVRVARTISHSFAALTREIIGTLRSGTRRLLERGG